MAKLPIVFLPGMMCDERLFIHQIDVLKEDREILVGDITCADTVQEIAFKVLKKAPDCFVLCGLSMGGIVAMEIMNQQTERVTGVALLDTNPMAETEETKQLRQPQMKRAQAGQLEALMREELKPNYLADGPSVRENMDVCMAMALSLGADVFVRQSRALSSRPDQRNTLKAIDIPSLVMCGRFDRLCPIHKHEMMYNLLPNSDFRIVEQAGHLPTLEQPETTTRHLQNWLEVCST